MKCLDVGCGGGFVTALMADIVGPEGEVVGIDADEEILKLARADAEAENTSNVTFVKFDASTQQNSDTANEHRATNQHRVANQHRAANEQFDENQHRAANHRDENQLRHDYYDLVYARFLLTHLSNPQHCLDAMIRSCKRGGQVIVEDIDFTGSLSYPPNHAFQRHAELYQQVVTKRGADPNIGPKLPLMLRRAGLQIVQLNIVQPAHFEGDDKLLTSITMQRIAAAVVAENIATEEEVNEVVDGLNAAAEDKDILISLPRIFQVWGTRI